MIEEHIAKLEESGIETKKSIMKLEESDMEVKKRIMKLEKMAGINIWKRTWEIIRNIGLGDALLKFLPRPPDDISRARHISCFVFASHLNRP